MLRAKEIQTKGNKKDAFFYKKWCEDLEKILKLWGDISNIGLSVKSWKAKVDEIFDMPSDSKDEDQN